MKPRKNMTNMILTWWRFCRRTWVGWVRYRQGRTRWVGKKSQETSQPFRQSKNWIFCLCHLEAKEKGTWEGSHFVLKSSGRFSCCFTLSWGSRVSWDWFIPDLIEAHSLGKSLRTDLTFAPIQNLPFFFSGGRRNEVPISGRWRWKGCVCDFDFFSVLILFDHWKQHLANI